MRARPLAVVVAALAAGAVLAGCDDGASTEPVRLSLGDWQARSCESFDEFVADTQALIRSRDVPLGPQPAPTPDAARAVLRRAREHLPRLSEEYDQLVANLEDTGPPGTAELVQQFNDLMAVVRAGQTRIHEAVQEVRNLDLADVDPDDYTALDAALAKVPAAAQDLQRAVSASLLDAAACPAVADLRAAPISG